MSRGAQKVEGSRSEIVEPARTVVCTNNKSVSGVAELAKRVRVQWDKGGNER